jgi:hypothetical protein
MKKSSKVFRNRPGVSKEWRYYTMLISVLLMALVLQTFAQNEISQKREVKSKHQTNKAAGLIPQPAQTDYNGPYPRVFPRSNFTHSLLIPLDPSFSIAPLSNGGNAPGVPPEYRNDDGFTDPISLPFSFDLYGSTFTEVFINNNGNISFGQGFPTFTSTGFPVTGFPMVAPFWADVDTRPLESGLTYYKVEDHRFTVIWDSVGYFNEHGDSLNTFELIITDGTDSLVGIGSNVCFSYGDMQWTTGDASGGVGGFGGTPATVGVNRGDGIDFIQIGRFDHPGDDYDGPGGNPDGVDFLDGKLFCFNTSLINFPPIANGFPPGNTISVAVGNTLNLSVSFLSPELNQTTTVSVNDGGLANFSYSTTPGNPAPVDIVFTPDLSQVGSHIVTVTFTATDDGTPPGVTVVDLTIIVFDNPPVCEITPGTSFNIYVGEFLTFDVTATDPDPGDVLTLEMFPGDVLPMGATMTPAISPTPLVGPSPLSSAFEWIPDPGQEGIYLFGYMITDSLGNQTFCKVDITVHPDSTQPQCEITNIDPGPPFTIEVTIQDNESGVAAINVVFSNNANITIPPFTPGTNDPIIVTAEKIDQTQSATVVLEVVDVAGNTTLCDPVTQRISAAVPQGFALRQNFPNPFNPATNIHFDIPASNSGAVDVAIKVYDITGREVITLVNKPMEPGRYQVQWDATNSRGETVAGGIYVYRMVAGDFVATRKMLLLK